MVLTPKKALDLIAPNKERIKSLETQIDKILTNGVKQDYKVIAVPVELFKNNAEKIVMRNLYAENGWRISTGYEVEIQYDRNESYDVKKQVLKFTPKEKFSSMYVP